MSIRHGLLALLTRGPRYGYQLRAEFERSTGSTWPLNIGQVYTTLSRLERDALVVPDGADGEGRHVYRITDAGAANVAAWFAAPVARGARPRDELAIKVALAVTTPGVDATAVLRAQRAATVRTLRDLTRLKADAPPPVAPGEHAELLVLESLIFQSEAEVRWLDHCEASIARVDTPSKESDR
ncbi:PadR family transcriptional regulator [Actinomadura flavalba]|uniref:PadR family transcriptional regulator n=1 Tax=Actinomadura flavalba TaxID=1120938 RepID=UPI0003678EE2|nr:PadR family transcriptional regulator [Actinomadura flavalba]